MEEGRGQKEDNEVLVVPGAVRDGIVAHALLGWPDEVCGLIAGRAGQAEELHPGRNVSATPRVAYELDVDTLARQIDFEAAGQDLVAIYHSHPAGPEEPSATDVARAYYPDAVYLICSLADPARPVVRGFRISNDSVTEVALVPRAT